MRIQVFTPVPGPTNVKNNEVRRIKIKREKQEDSFQSSTMPYVFGGVRAELWKVFGTIFPVEVTV